MQIILTIFWRLITLASIDNIEKKTYSVSKQLETWRQMHTKLQMDFVYLIGEKHAETTVLNGTITELKEEIETLTNTINEMSESQLELHIKIKHLALELEQYQKGKKKATTTTRRKKTSE